MKINEISISSVKFRAHIRSLIQWCDWSLKRQRLVTWLVSSFGKHSLPLTLLS